jgi:hypothetical protein
MVQRGQCPRFALEACQSLGIVGKGVRENLDRDVAPEVGVDRAPHLPHAAGADRGGHFIRAEPRARG